jgi:hypothetical protein
VASAELPPGLYDDLVTVALAEVLDQLDDSRREQRRDLDESIAPVRSALGI